MTKKENDSSFQIIWEAHIYWYVSDLLIFSFISNLQEPLRTFSVTSF